MEPCLRNNHFVSAALLDGDEDQPFPGEHDIFKARINAGLEAIFEVMVTRAMAHGGGGMPGDCHVMAAEMAAEFTRNANFHDCQAQQKPCLMWQ